MKVPIAISARHIHLSKSDLETLFGDGYQLKIDKKLSQANEFKALERVTLKTNKNEIPNVAIIGPARLYTQVEISKTDSYLLGIDPPVRNTGDLEGTATVTIIGPSGSIEKPCCIIANRHIHINSEAMELFDLKPNQIVTVKVNTIKGGTMNNVHVKYGEDYKLEMHIDLDDANSHLLSNNDYAYIIKE